jgi:hypothetical protein
MDWNSLHWQLRDALIDVFEKGRLEDLRLVGLNNFPLFALERNTTLRNMCFGWLWTAKTSFVCGTESRGNSSQAVFSRQSSRPQLKFLNLSFEHNENQGTALINQLLQPDCPVEVARLKHVVINGDQHLNIQCLFNHCQDDLKFLEIRSMLLSQYLLVG